MSFDSYLFYIFFGLVVVVNFLLPRSKRWIWWLIASYLFCIVTDIRWGVVLLVSSLVSYGCALALRNDRVLISKKRLLQVGIIINIGLLLSTKYLNFLFESVNPLFSLMSTNLQLGSVELLLPVGISFYTLQTISYMVDVYKNKIQPETNFWHYALYVAFFPKLVAGPIERASHFLPQLSRSQALTYERFINSMVRILWGMFKKNVVADRLAVVVNTVFAAPDSFYSPQILLAVLFYSFQIFIDFSAYCDIVIGLAGLLGIDLVENFNRPYLATSVADFWRRWHISFSNWLRDYIFLPLHYASRRKRSRLYLYRSILITFLVSGFWHGAAWTFVIWGMLHSLYQIIEAATQDFQRHVTHLFHINPDSVFYRGLQIVQTFLLVSFAWIFFRAESIKSALDIIYRLATLQGIKMMQAWQFDVLSLGRADLWLVLIALIFILLVDSFQEELNPFKVFRSQPLVLRWGLYLFLIFSILIFRLIISISPMHLSIPSFNY